MYRAVWDCGYPILGSAHARASPFWLVRARSDLAEIFLNAGHVQRRPTRQAWSGSHLAQLGLEAPGHPGQPIFVQLPESGVNMMHRLPSSANAVIVIVGTLSLITITMVISDAVAVSSFARDVIRVAGVQLVGLAGSAWQRQAASRKTT